MIKKPLVTLIIPSYNHVDYIEETLKSAVNNGYENQQIIVIEDGSTDDSPKILKALNKIYDFELIIQENSGLSVSLNLAIKKYTKGIYIKILSSDDLLPKESISRLVEYMQKHPYTDVIYGAFKVIDKNSKVLKYQKPIVKGEVSYKNYLKGRIKINTTTSFFRADFFKKNGYYETNVVSEDIYMNRKVFKHANVSIVNFCTSCYRYHSSNTSGDSWLMYIEALKALKKMKDDEFYQIKERIEFLNYFVSLATDYKKESMKYLIPSLRFFYKRLFWIGVVRILSINTIIKKNIN